MRTKDLMIGDWVKYINGRYIDIRLARIIDIEMFSEGVIFLEPIPLTPKILEENGFTRDLKWHHCDANMDNYNVTVQLGYANKIEYVKIVELGKDNCVPSERTKLYLTHIKYVHQLQHTLRLCGIKDEIVL